MPRAMIRAFNEVDEAFLRSGDYDEGRTWRLNIKGIGERNCLLRENLGKAPHLSGARGVNPFLEAT